MELTGTIIAVLPAQSGVSQRTGNPWMSQDYVLEVPGQYPRRCTFRIFGEDRIKQFAIQQGEQNLTVYFDIDAHEYNGRWFTSIRGWKGEKTDDATPATSAPAQVQTPEAAPAAGEPQVPDFGQQSNDDLPF